MDGTTINLGNVIDLSCARYFNWTDWRFGRLCAASAHGSQVYALAQIRGKIRKCNRRQDGRRVWDPASAFSGGGAIDKENKTNDKKLSGLYPGQKSGYALAAIRQRDCDGDGYKYWFLQLDRTEIFPQARQSYIDLDQYGSFVWLLIDGERSVFDISGKWGCNLGKGRSAA